MPKRWRLFALIALIILLLGGSVPFLMSWLSTILPAASATVTMTPTNQHLTKTYTVSAVTGTPDASQNQVQARLLSYTTPGKSLTVKATGQCSRGITTATGTLIFSNATQYVTIYAQTFTDYSGVGVVTDTAVDIGPGQTIVVPAHADKPGSTGNVRADDINATYDVGPNGIWGTVHVENTAPFTGGQDQTYTFVQQSDIDDATPTMVNQLTSDAQASLQQQVRANEELVSSTMQCDPTIKSNHKALDEATDVMLTVTVTCKGEAYDQQATRSLATDLFGSDATSQLGANYALVGDVVIGIPQVLTTGEYGGPVTLSISAEGMWVYQFSDAQKHTFAQLIAGKPLADAQTLLLKQEGVKKVSISTTGGWGAALPTSASDIKFTLVAVPGLQATP